MPLLNWDLHLGWLVLGGVALIALTTLPRLLHARPLSVPILYVAMGYLAFELIPELDGPRPVVSRFDAALIEYVTEFVVIVSLVSAGLRIERRPGLAEWSSVWRLLAIAMTASVAAIVALGSSFAGLTLASAILLGGVLAPTDPVLADDVQIPRPGDDDERDEIRFTLTAEAGLNDGLAFPFVHLAIAVLAAGLAPSLPEWALVDVLLAVGLGVGAGWVLGTAINHYGRFTGEFFRTESREGLFGLGATLLVYGATEAVGGYGFLAVFVAALVRGHADVEYRRESHGFLTQIESVVMALVLIGFGAVLSEGILDALTWRGAVVGGAIVLAVRPLIGWLSLLGRPLPAGERAAMAFFGIRGMGSLYYLAYATTHADFGPELAEVWSITAFTILVSIGLHGATASPLMARIDRRRERTTTNAPDSEEIPT